MVNPYSKPMNGKCQKCNLPGHRSNECPQRKATNIIAREANEDEEGYQFEPDREDGEFKDHVEKEITLFVRRMILALKHKGKPHRHQLFLTRCPIKRAYFCSCD